MPGGRLSAEERRQIAQGLSEDRPYAEIARQLSRPTSTISREVARNGGVIGYGAEQAQGATQERVRQRRHTSTSRRVHFFETEGRDGQAVLDFAEEFATLLTQTGLSRMASRVLVHLFVTDAGSLSTAELVQRLRVSPASISKAVGLLEALDLIRRDRIDRRKERYSVDDDVWMRAWLASAKKNTDWAVAARGGVKILGASTPAGIRLRTTGEFFAHLGLDMAGAEVTPSRALSGDARIIVAAFHYAETPLTTEQLGVSLTWSPDRVTQALHEIGTHPEWLDPLRLQRVGKHHYGLSTTDVLTPGQRRALQAVQDAAFNQDHRAKRQ
jgi:Helix-turn-helix domain/MarR family